VVSNVLKDLIVRKDLVDGQLVQENQCGAVCETQIVVVVPFEQPQSRQFYLSVNRMDLMEATGKDHFGKSHCRMVPCGYTQPRNRFVNNIIRRM